MTSLAKSIKGKGEEMTNRISNLDERKQKNKVLFLETAPQKERVKVESHAAQHSRHCP